MTASETLRARVEPRLARAVRRWARENQVDVSEAIRRALERLVTEGERDRKLRETMGELRRIEATGLFDLPPPEKAGGFR